MSFIGAEIIDHSLGAGKFKTDDTLKLLKSGRVWDWANSGDFQGYSGRGGAVKISEKVIREIADDSAVSINQLIRRLCPNSESDDFTKTRDFVSRQGKMVEARRYS
jgi:hypothetical protein